MSLRKIVGGAMSIAGLAGAFYFVGEHRTILNSSPLREYTALQQTSYDLDRLGVLYQRNENPDLSTLVDSTQVSVKAELRKVEAIPKLQEQRNSHAATEVAGIGSIAVAVLGLAIFRSEGKKKYETDGTRGASYGS